MRHLKSGRLYQSKVLLAAVRLLLLLVQRRRVAESGARVVTPRIYGAHERLALGLFPLLLCAATFAYVNADKGRHAQCGATDQNGQHRNHEARYEIL